MPLYLKDLDYYVPERDLRSQDPKLFIVPKPNLKTNGNMVFTVTGPFIWNTLPLSLRTVGNVAILKRHLQTFLLNKYL